MSSLIVGLLLLWLAPRWVDTLVERVSNKPLPSVGWGLIGLVGVPVAMLISLGVVGFLAVALGLLTLGRLVGLTLGLGLFGESALALGFWFALGFVGHIVVGLILGRRLLERVSPARARGRRLQLLLGLVVLATLGAVPLLGGLVRLLAALLGLGAIGAWLFDRQPGHELNQAVSES